MKFLIIDPHGDALDVAIRAQSFGHDVRHFIRPNNPRTENIGRGLVNVVRDYRPLDWADLILLADNKLYIKEIDDYRRYRRDARIVGATENTAAWELDREKGQEVLERNGIRTIQYKLFDDYEAAIKYVEKEQKRLVSKPCGDADKALSYVAGGPDPVRDMVFMLRKWRRRQTLKERFILQDHIDGIEMAADGWFGPQGFDRGWGESFEFKKLMPSDFGINTGEMGTVLRFTDRSKLARQVLKPLEEDLDRFAYCGYVSVNCIIDKDGHPWPLEFTMRPGYPTINIESAVHTIADPAERLMLLAQGRDSRSVEIDKIAVGVVVALPSFPHAHSLQKEIDGLPVFGTEELGDDLHCCQMRKGELDYSRLATAGDYCFVVASAGDTVSRTAAAVYNSIGRVHIPGGTSVRDDIGERLKYDLPSLQEHGYATEMRY
jgi:phosphoribosylamine---glycine ligase